MRTIYSTTAVSVLLLLAAFASAQEELPERVYFIPAKFVEMVNESDGIVISNEAFVRVGEAHDGRVDREWTIRIPHGHALQVQDLVHDQRETWLRLVPESLISPRFRRRHNPLSHIQRNYSDKLHNDRTAGNPWMNASRSPIQTYARHDRNSQNLESTISGHRPADVALADYVEFVPGAPSMVDMPVDDYHMFAPPQIPADRSNPYTLNGCPPMATIPPANRTSQPISIPPMIGGFFDNSNLNVDVTTEHSFNVIGQIISMNPNGAMLVYERDGTGVFNDLVSIPGTGTDASGDGIIDTYEVSEPLPPSDIPTAPSPSATFSGGTATYTAGISDTAIDGQFGNNEIWRADYGFVESLEMVAPGGVQRITVADNNSPVPRDRVHFDYRYYHNATAGFGSVHRYTFGIEKTYFNDRFSIDARLPFAGAWDSVRFEGETGMRSTDFGDINLFLKSRIAELQNGLISGGIGFGFPSGPDSRLFRSDGTQVVWIKNEAFHLLPFVGTIWVPNDYFFVQSFLQIDFDTHGNTVSGSSAGGRLPTIGKFRDSTLLSADTSVGYWIIRNPGPQRRLQGLAAIAELNYAKSLEDADSISAEGIRITDAANRLNVLDVAVGLHGQIGQSLSLTSAMTFPLRSGYNSRSDWEIAGLVSWLF